MSLADLGNGFFEGGGSVLMWLNIRRLLADKQVQGVSLVPAMFWTVWGYWNLFYYPHLHQWLSFVGGIGVVLANSIWVVLALHYSYKAKHIVPPVGVY